MCVISEGSGETTNLCRLVQVFTFVNVITTKFNELAHSILRVNHFAYLKFLTGWIVKIPIFD